MAIGTVLDDITTLRHPTTVIPKQQADMPKATPAAPTVKSAGQGQVQAKNPFSDLPSEDAYNQTAAAHKAATEAAAASQRQSSGAAGDLIALAKKYVGTPYVWGASSPLGFDCSGFTQYVFKQFGVNLPRVSNQQGFGGQAVASMQDAKPGDLIFWDNSSRNNGADHVGIYLGNGMLISAPKPGDHVKVQAVYGKPFFRRYL